MPMKSWFLYGGKGGLCADGEKFENTPLNSAKITGLR